MKTITAQLRHLRIAPRKTRFIADVIRGLSVNEAEARLTLSPQRPSLALLKLLRSAISNATHNAKLDPGTLFIKEIRVNQAPKLVRYWPRARGSMAKIEKKSSHITLVLAVSDKPLAPGRAGGQAKRVRYTFIPKPKKSKADESHTHSHEPKEKDDKIKPEKEKVSPKPKKEGGGMFRKMFNRKSI